jgi:hypothetical protein
MSREYCRFGVLLSLYLAAVAAAQDPNPQYVALICLSLYLKDEKHCISFLADNLW